MADLKPTEILDAIEKWTIIELNEFVESFCEKFDVSAAAPVAVATAPGVAVAEPEDEQTEFTVVLESTGEDKATKLKIVKQVKDLLGVGLRDAKELVDKAPAELAQDIAKDDAENMKKKIEDLGGKVTVK